MRLQVNGLSRQQWETRIRATWTNAEFVSDGTWVTAYMNSNRTDYDIVGVYGFVRNGGWLDT